MIKYPAYREITWGIFHEQQWMNEVHTAVFRTHGPTFKAKRAEDILAGLSGVDVQRELYKDLTAQIDAYNAVTMPIDNGPADRLWLLECEAMVDDALRREDWLSLALWIERERNAVHAIDWSPHTIYRCTILPAYDPSKGFACTSKRISIVGFGKTPAAAAADFDRQYRGGV